MALGLLDLCRDKLYAQMASSRLNLRQLVGHSNLLDALVDEFNRNPDYYNYVDPSDSYADANATAMCGIDDASRAQDTDVLPAYPIQGEATTRDYAWRFPATDPVFSRYRRDSDDDEEEDEDGEWETDDDDDDEDPIISSPPARVLTVRNPDPDPALPTLEEPATSRNKVASHTLEPIPEEDATPPESDPIYPSKPSKQSSTLRGLLPTPTVSKRRAASFKSSASAKKPLLSAVKEVWWKGGDCVSPPVCV
jgi:hypothetical protein